MNIYHQQYPTRGDLAREQLRQRGYLYSGDVLEEVKRRLKNMTLDTRKAFALGCAERLMQKHEALPEGEQRPFTLTWRPVINTMWSGLQGDDAAFVRVDQILSAFHESFYDHDDGEDGPDDADEDAAAASIEAAECFVYGRPEPAHWAASRTVEWVSRLADAELGIDINDFAWDPNAEPSPIAKQDMLPVVQNELRRFIFDLNLLETQGVTAAVVQSLKLPVNFPLP